MYTSYYTHLAQPRTILAVLPPRQHGGKNQKFSQQHKVELRACSYKLCTHALLDCASRPWWPLVDKINRMNLYQLDVARKQTRSSYSDYHSRCL